jgi:hypothetical protein
MSVCAATEQGDAHHSLAMDWSMLSQPLRNSFKSLLIGSPHGLPQRLSGWGYTPSDAITLEEKAKNKLFCNDLQDNDSNEMTNCPSSNPFRVSKPTFAVFLCNEDEI